MNLKRTIGTALLALTLVPAYVAAAEDMELKATVVSKDEKEIKVKTKDDEKTILVGSKTKALENAKEGSKVTIKYTEKEGQLRATEINPRYTTAKNKNQKRRGHKDPAFFYVENTPGRNVLPVRRSSGEQTAADFTLNRCCFFLMAELMRPSK